MKPSNAVESQCFFAQVNALNTPESEGAGLRSGSSPSTADSRHEPELPKSLELPTVLPELMVLTSSGTT